MRKILLPSAPLLFKLIILRAWHSHCLLNTININLVAYLLVKIFQTSIAACVSLFVFEKQPEGSCQDAFRRVLLLFGFAFGVRQNGQPYLSFVLVCNEDN